MSACRLLAGSELALFLEGEVTGSKASEIEAHLAVCPTCRAHLEQDRQIVAALSVTDAELEQLDLVPALRVLGRDAARPARRRRSPWVLGLTAAACLALLGGLALLVLPNENEYRLKGAAPAAFAQDRWVGLDAYQVISEQPSKLGETLPPGADLLFAYSNTGDTPFRYLMVFAIDSRGAVHWFYPAFERPGTDPLSIPISAGERLELRERIRHDYAPGELTIVGLFTRAPLKVSEVEALIGRAGGGRLPLEGSGQQVIHTRVQP